MELPYTVDATLKIAAKSLYFLVQLKRAKFPSQELVKFYVACIQPILTYACQVYHNALPEYLSLSLKRIQKRPMRIIYGCDLSYKEALPKSRLSNLYQHGSELCHTFLIFFFINRDGKFFYHLM